MTNHPLPFEKPINTLEQQLTELEQQANPTPATQEAIRRMRAEILKVKQEIYNNLDAWEIVQVARHPDRPQTKDYIDLICEEFVELHGDHAFGDDRAILTGFAKIGDQKVLLVGHQKGRTLKDRTTHNYGMAHPEGYRKALQKMQLAAKYHLPIVCLIDTSGAYPGIGAEERGVAYQIAYNLREMSRLETPIVCAVIGEGGSGGALGIGMGDHILILQYAYYSVISPEGCAGILWKHVKHADKAARALRFTSRDLLKMGVVDEVVPEPLGAAHRDQRSTAASLKQAILNSLKQLSKVKRSEIQKRRYEKFRKLGQFLEQVEEQGVEEEAAAG